MNHREAGRCWNDNADAWSALSRAGHNIFRDRLLNPAFFALLPEVAGLTGLDIGCGDGDNTRLVAARGARMVGLDIASRFVAIARETEQADPLGIDYVCASAVELPFPDASFDFAVAFASLMDVPEFECALAEARRVLRPGGFLQFSITHPCTAVPHRRPVRDENGDTLALELGGYFTACEGEMEQWLFNGAPEEVRAQYRPFRHPKLHHTLTEWLTALLAAGFALEAIAEPTPSPQILAQFPETRAWLIWPHFLLLRGRKPSP